MSRRAEHGRQQGGLLLAVAVAAGEGFSRFCRNDGLLALLDRHVARRVLEPGEEFGSRLPPIGLAAQRFADDGGHRRFVDLRLAERGVAGRHVAPRLARRERHTRPGGSFRAVASARATSSSWAVASGRPAAPGRSVSLAGQVSDQGADHAAQRQFLGLRSVAATGGSDPKVVRKCWPAMPWRKSGWVSRTTIPSSTHRRHGGWPATRPAGPGDRSVHPRKSGPQAPRQSSWDRARAWCRRA